MRVGLVLPLCAVLLWVSVGVTLNIQLADSAPVLALRWWPWGAEAKAGLAGQELTADPTPDEARRAEQLARQSLARAPVLAVAARLLGLARASLGGERGADPIFAYAQAVSRRDLPTQLWFIQRQVEVGNVVGALTHYDIALRTDEAADDLLLPVLAAASANDNIAQALAPYLARRPVWGRGYLGRLAALATNPITLFRQARAARLHSAADAALLDSIVNRLVALDRPDLGRALLGQDYGALLQDGSFENDGAFPPFDWWLRNEADSSAYRDTVAQGEGRHVLHIVAKADQGGEVARQLLLLPTGRYVLGGIAASTGENAAFAVSLDCDHSGVSVMAAPVPAPSTPRRFAVPFDVPAGCAAQWLHVNTPPAQTMDGWVDALSIVPERAAPRNPEGMR